MVDSRCRLLVLGSLPGVRSIEMQQYYAHPQNGFWTIMGAVLGVVLKGDYEQRCRTLQTAGVGLWDVLRSSHRKGSLDAHIAADSAIPNDINGLLQRYGGTKALAFNGQKAGELYRRFIAGSQSRTLHTIQLPSSSAAHAAMTLDEKIEHWSRLREYLPQTKGANT